MSTDFLDINLLPPQTRSVEQVSTRRRSLFLPLTLFVFSLMILFGMLYLKARNDRILTAQEQEIQQLTLEAQEVDRQQAEIDQLQQQVTSLATQAEQLRADAERVERENPALAPFLQILVSSLPPRMKLTGLVPNGPNRFLLKGEAGSDALVIEYANTLKQHPSIRAVTPSSIQQLGGSGTPGAVTWTLEVER